jgi:Flp pilus assembly protein TadG
MHLQLFANRRKRRGVAAVEFAIVAPLLFVLVLGLIEFGRVMMVQEILVNAAREGARTGTLPGSAVADVESTVNNYLDSSSIPHAYATIAVYDNGVQQASGGTTPIGVAGDQIQVTITVPFNSVSWLATPLFMGGKTLGATVVMRKESNNT